MSQNISEDRKSDALKKAFDLINHLKSVASKPRENKNLGSQKKVAIIGASCNFPGGADDTKKFWQLLTNKDDPLVDIPSERFELTSLMSCTRASLVDDIYMFDNEFFNLSPREAMSMDPQHRLLLQTSWNLFQASNIKPSALVDQRVGVFLGISPSEYLQKQIQNDIELLDIHTGTGNNSSFSAGRLAHFYGLQGPTLTVDTTCSSSLVSIHLACQSIIANESRMAISGGVSLIINDKTMEGLSKMNALSSDGKCKTFDDAADGYGRGEGCGLILLKNFEDALADKDNIIGVILASSLNHDGNSSGLTIPNGLSQESLMKSSLEKAQIEPNEINYIEAHGTGTKIGDPIELNSINSVFLNKRKVKDKLLIGAVKSNIGHLEEAAGIASVIKVLSAYQFGILPGNRNYTTGNQLVDWNALPLEVVNENIDISDKVQFTSCVNSFGMSGTNANLIIQCHKANKKNYVSSKDNLFVLSCKNKDSLDKYVESYKKYLTENKEVNIADLCYTLQSCREHFEHRFAANCETKEDLLKYISDAKKNSMKAKPFFSSSVDKRLTVFLFTGQGSQYPGMGLVLYNTYKQFRETVDYCCQLIGNRLPHPLLEVIYGEKQTLLSDTLYAQPAIFIVEYALAKFLISVGIEPDILIGHSIGELAAVCIAESISLSDSIDIVLCRAKSMSAVAIKGAMLVVHVGLDELDSINLDNYPVDIAAVNSPNQIVLSGSLEDIDRVAKELDTLSIKYKLLSGSYAFHSHHMNQAANDFEIFIKGYKFKAPNKKIISTLTGDYINEKDKLNSNYWKRQITSTVKFSQAILSLSKEDNYHFIEIGPMPILINFVSDTFTSTSPYYLDYVMSHKVASTIKLNKLVKNSYLVGAKIRWDYLNTQSLNKVSSLPQYPFNKVYFNAFNKQESLMKLSETNGNKSIGQSTDQRQIKLTKLHNEIRSLIASLLHMDESKLTLEKPFLELGADSIMLVETIQKIQAQYGVQVSIRQLFEELVNIKELAIFIDNNIADDYFVDEPAEKNRITNTLLPVAQEEKIVEHTHENISLLDRNEEVLSDNVNSSYDGNNRILIEQIELMRMQLDLISGASSRLRPQKKRVAEVRLKEGGSEVIGIKPWQTMVSDKRELEKDQQTYLNNFINEYIARTSKSRSICSNGRKVLADIRNSISLRYETKRLIYPISAQKTYGSKMVDVDRNEYIDITMGYGAHLFGHNPQFVTDAINKQLKLGLHIGPRADRVTEAAELITELVDMDRAVFCNSGTHAVATAIRIARAASKKDLIIMFSNSYHGHSIETLALSRTVNGEVTSFPMTSGVPQSNAEQVIVLPYNDKKSLSLIRKYADRCAAVLVEPVQSRNPNIQPREFLHLLRKLTEELGLILIFDEMVVGFRIENGGCQSYFGVKADMATYGKALGAGMPIGIVAGRKDLLDYIDGGDWQYDDDSLPETETVFFGGTYNQNPLSIASACAVLHELKNSNNKIQEALNQRANKFVGCINQFTKEYKFPIRVDSFGTLFRFSSLGNYSYLFQPLEMDLFYYHLIHNGVYVWEGRTCYISTEHKDADLNFIIKVIIKSLLSLRSGGFYPLEDAEINSKLYSISEESTEKYLFSQDVSDGMCKFWERSSSKLAKTSNEIHEPSVVNLTTRPDFSLSFFGNYSANYSEDKYNLLYEAVKFADKRDFCAVWLPERHFHEFGGLSPNPSVVAAGLAKITHNIQLRAGSVVLPLHHPVRMSEDWSLVDNISDGRVGIAFASGWHPNDFIFSPDSYGHHKEVMFDKISQVTALWAGDAVTYNNGNYDKVKVKIHPLPKQPELPSWITVVNNPSTYYQAGKLGMGILTNLMGQNTDDLEKNIKIYHSALKEYGHDIGKAKVTVLLHAFVSDDYNNAIETARQPFYAYMKASAGLFNMLAKSEGINLDVNKLSAEDEKYILEAGYAKYIDNSSLIGTPESCRKIINKLVSIGVTEIACFVDFGVDGQIVQANLKHIHEIKKYYSRKKSSKTIYEMPLLDGQKTFLEQMQMGNESSAASHQRLVIKITGKLSSDILKKAIEDAIVQHESLRTAFSQDKQYVFKSADLAFEAHDFSSKSTGQVDEWFLDETKKVFDFKHPALVRFYLLRLSLDQNLFVITSHHILSDGWSMGLLSKAIFSNYLSIESRGELTLSPSYQYSDYVNWYFSYIKSDSYIKDKEYWEGVVKPTRLECLDLLVSNYRKEAKSYCCSRKSIKLDSASVLQLKLAAKESRVTLFNYLFAVYIASILRCKTDKSVSVGVPISVRTFPGSEEIIGYCTNIVPVQLKAESSLTFVDLLSIVQDKVIKGFDHRSFPFAKFSDLDVLKNKDFLIQNLFNMDKPVGIDGFDEFKFELVNTPKMYGAFELNMSVLEFESELIIDLDYNSDLYTHAQIEIFLNIFQTILGSSYKQSYEKVSKIGLKSNFNANNHGKDTLPSSASKFNNEKFLLHKIFEDEVSLSPDKVSVEDTKHKYTNVEINERSNQLACYLIENIIPTIRYVAVCMERSVESIISVLGILKAGGVVTLIDLNKLNPGRIKNIAEDVGGRLPVITKMEHSEFFNDENLTPIYLDAEALSLKDFEKTLCSVNVKPYDPAYLIYTSGTTGRPKAVIGSHQGIANRFHWMWDRYPFKEDEAVMLSSATDTNDFLWDVLGVISGGGVLKIPEAAIFSDLNQFIDYMGNEKISRIELMPNKLMQILNTNMNFKEKFKSLWLCGLGSERAPLKLVKKFKDKLPDSILISRYGSTESTSVLLCELSTCEYPDSIIAPLGYPTKNSKVYIVDDDFQQVPEGVIGQIAIASIGNAIEYLNLPKKTQEKFIPNYFGDSFSSTLYLTGDLGRYTLEVGYEYLGRMENQIYLPNNSRFPIENIERRFLIENFVEDVVVLKNYNDVICVYLKIKNCKAEHEERCNIIIKEINTLLLPISIHYLNEYPRSKNGKIDFKLLNNIDTKSVVECDAV